MNKRDINWNITSSQVLRAVRAKRSQVAFSRRLGYRSRPVADWEAGRRFPTASTFLKACRLSGIDCQQALERFHSASARLIGEASDADIARWLSELKGSTSIVALSKASGIPRFSIGRWLSGDSRPRLPQFFALIEAMTGRASDMIAEFVVIEKIPELLPSYKKQQAAKKLAYEEPWSALILRVMETEAFGALQQYQPGWIAQVLGISSETETRCMQQLKDAGMVSIQPDTGKPMSLPQTVDTQASSQAMNELKNHWANVAADKVFSAGPSDLFSFNLISVSETDMLKIKEMLRFTFREIRSIVSASTPIEQVALVQLQLATWNPATQQSPLRK